MNQIQIDSPSSLFTGYWKLDRERSDPPTIHLESIGLSDLAREAAEKMEIGMHIEHNLYKHTVLIIQDSILGEKQRLLTVGQEHTEQARDGSSIRMKLDYGIASTSSSSSSLTSVSSVSFSNFIPSNPPLLRIQVEWGNNIRITETKTIMDNGNELLQEIIMTMKGKITKTKRLFIKSIPPPPSSLSSTLNPSPLPDE